MLIRNLHCGDFYAVDVLYQREKAGSTVIGVCG